MKRFFSCLFMFSASVTFAQHTLLEGYRGVYLSAQDFLDHKLSYAVKCDSSKQDIKSDNVFSQRHIEFEYGGKKIKLDRDSIFGYRDRSQKNFRILPEDSHNYEILENAPMVIYKTEIRKYDSTGKNFTMESAFFFSSGMTTEVLPLTVLNLKKATPGNLKFHDALDVEFPNGKDLERFDKTQQLFRVNVLLLQSNAH